MAFVKFLTPREACSKIYSVCNSELDKLDMRPWNRYEPDDTAWWLVPSDEWPAYRHGKFHFDWGDNNHDSLLFSLHFEKGLGSIVSSVYDCPKGSRCIMKDNWSWYQLIRNLRDGSISHKVAQISQEIPIPIELLVSGGHLTNPCDYDSNNPGYEWDTCCFSWDNKQVCFTQKRLIFNAGHLKPLSGLKTFGELSQILSNFNTNDTNDNKNWIWIDFHIGISLKIQTKTPSNQVKVVWTASYLWQKFFKPLSPWLI